MEDAHFSSERAVLIEMAKKYLWWQIPEQALSDPWRIIAAAMNLGSFGDYHRCLALFGQPMLAAVIERAAPGWFSPKSWSFWHRVLDLVAPEEPVPPPPVRSFK